MSALVKGTFAREKCTTDVLCEKCEFYTPHHRRTAIVPNDPEKDPSASGSGPSVLMIHVERGQKRRRGGPVFTHAASTPVARNVVELDRTLDGSELGFRVKGTVTAGQTDQRRQRWKEADEPMIVMPQEVELRTYLFLNLFAGH